jgi:SNF2 family DNA or RNA helicase
MTREQVALYEEIMEQSFNRIKGSNDIERRGHVLAMLTALKQICNHPDHYLQGEGPLKSRSGKLTRVEHILDHIMKRGERTLIFTQYRAMGNRLRDYFQKRYQTNLPFLHGGTPAPQREEMVRIFQEEEDAPPILFVSLRAGGTGLNLTRATHVVHYDRWWNPAVEDQATDRAYRIGQERNVSVYKMICQGTLEERIDELLEQKRALADQVVGSGERWVTELDDDALRSLVSLGDDAVVLDT